MFRYFLVISALFLFYSVNAQNSDTIYTDSVKVNKLEEVEVKAMYSGVVNRRFPATVYSVGGFSNEIILPVNINEGLNKIPSIFAHSGTFNTSRITMRGIGTRSLYGTRKINALLNEIPLTSGEGDTFIDDIDPQFINNIEVIGGPTSGIYGPALGGTILLNARVGDNQNSVYLNSGAGSFGTFHNFINVNLRSKSIHILLAYKNIQSDGYRQNNNFNRSSALLNIESYFKKSTVNALILFTDVNSEIPSSIDSITFASEPSAAAANWVKTNGREHSTRFLTGLTYRYNFNKNLISSVNIYGLFKKAEEVRPFDFLNEKDIAGGLKFYIKKKFDAIPGLTITPGFSAYIENYKPSLFENIEGVGEKGRQKAENEENIFHANAFLIAEYIPDDKNFVTLSINGNKYRITDRNVFTASPKQQYQQEIHYSPRVSYSRKVARNHFLFSSLSHGLSYPSIAEILYPDGTISGEVKPERAWNLEAGLKGIELFNEVKYSVSLYYMPVKDLIVPERIAEDTYVGKNIGKSLHMGIEFTLEKTDKQNQSAGWFYVGDYRFFINIQSNKFKEFTSDNANIKNNKLPGVPDSRIFASVLFKLKEHFFIEPEFYRNGKMAMTDDNSLYYEGYSLFNIKTGYSQKLKKLNLRLSASANNLFDKKYASMILINAPATNNRAPRYYYPGLPRNFYFSLAVGYNL